jgi:hypothetical protein
MNLIKLKPATQLINGVQSPCYGIYCGNELLRTVSVFNYTDTLRSIRRYNVVIEQQIRQLTDRAKRMAAGRKALELCEKLTVSRQRLTQKTFIAANKAAGLGN